MGQACRGEVSEELQEAMNDFRQQCRDLTTGLGRREEFEVLAEA
jgi:hypothetical protein